MAMVLEMPEVLDTAQPATPTESESAADEAADILDQASDDNGPDLPFDTNEPTSPPDACDQPASSELPPAPPAEPKKKKRGRKKKDKSSTPPSIDVATETRDQPTPVDPVSQPKMSPSTRLMQIASVESEFIEVCLEINDLEAIIESSKDQIKTASKRQSALAIELRQLRNDPQWQPKLFDEKNEQPVGTEAPGSNSAASPVASVATSSDAQPAAVSQPAVSPADPDAWKSVSIDALNLPGKLGEKLKDANAETIGRLENLRAEISQGREKWPPGIGKARVTQIENSIIDWLSKNRDAAVLAEAKAQAQSAASNGQPIPSAVAVTPSAPAAAAPTMNFDQWEALSEEQQQEFICARAVLIDDGKENCLATKHPKGSQFWDSGYAALGRGEKVSECPYVAGPEMDDWIRGWLAHGAVEKYEPTLTAKGTNLAPAIAALKSLDDL